MGTPPNSTPGGGFANGSSVMEIRVKDITDVTSFSGQIGTCKGFTLNQCKGVYFPCLSVSAELLSEFDDFQLKLSSWCENHSSVLEATGSMKKEDIVAVQEVERGVWSRAKVSKIVSQK